MGTQEGLPRAENEYQTPAGELQARRDYYQRNRERLCQYQRDYYQNNKEKRRAYYEKNRYSYCYRTLNKYAPRAIDKVQNACPAAVDEYYKRYPFEDFAERIIRYRLRKNEIYPSQAKYDDCYDACVLAYLYSIHRCAYLGVDYVRAYISKMIRIYMMCAIVVYDDAKNLCRENNFREVRIDAEYSVDRF